jgi:hypothetical protein
MALCITLLKHGGNYMYHLQSFHSVCYMFHIIIRTIVVTFLNNINFLNFVAEIEYVFHELEINH